jgi:hypothetical protein
MSEAVSQHCVMGYKYNLPEPIHVDDITEYNKFIVSLQEIEQKKLSRYVESYVCLSCSHKKATIISECVYAAKLKFNIENVDNKKNYDYLEKYLSANKYHKYICGNFDGVYEINRSACQPIVIKCNHCLNDRNEFFNYSIIPNLIDETDISLIQKFKNHIPPKYVGHLNYELMQEYCWNCKIKKQRELDNASDYVPMPIPLKRQKEVCFFTQEIKKFYQKCKHTEVFNFNYTIKYKNI